MTMVSVNGKIKQLSLMDRNSGTDYSNDFLGIGEHPEWGTSGTADIELTESEFEWWEESVKLCNPGRTV